MFWGGDSANDEAVYRTSPATPGLLINEKSRIQRQSISRPMRIVAPMPSMASYRRVDQGDFRPLPNKNVQMLDHFFPLLYPKDSEVGAKRPLNGTSKVEKVREKNFLGPVVSGKVG